MKSWMDAAPEDTLGETTIKQGNRLVFQHDLEMLQEFVNVMEPMTRGVRELYCPRISVPIVSNNGYHVATASYENDQWGFDFTRYGDPL